MQNELINGKFAIIGSHMIRSRWQPFDDRLNDEWMDIYRLNAICGGFLWSVDLYGFPKIGSFWRVYGVMNGFDAGLNPFWMLFDWIVHFLCIIEFDFVKKNKSKEIPYKKEYEYFFLYLFFIGKSQVLRFQNALRKIANE